MTTSNITLLTKREIFVNEIVFFSKDEISLFGFLQEREEFFETQYIITRKDFRLLLSNSHYGVELLWRIENLFVLPHQAPASLNLIDLFGTTLSFEAHNIRLDVPYYEGENGELKPYENRGLLFIEEVIPFPSARKNSF